MSIVITFEDFTPAPRFDELPWTGLRIEEAPLVTGDWTQIDTFTFDVPDPDPENPQARDFTTENGTALNLWYRIIFVDGSGDESLPTTPLQNVASGATPTVYADVDELARILKIRQPSDAQTTAMRRVLYAAAAEIDAELGREDSFSLPYPALVVEVNLERAVEHWQQEESAFGLIGLGETAPAFAASDTWNRHAHKLAPLKESWGIG